LIKIVAFATYPTDIAGSGKIRRCGGQSRKLPFFDRLRGAREWDRGHIKLAGAKAALGTAWYDALGRIHRVPLCHFLGAQDGVHSFYAFASNLGIAPLSPARIRKKSFDISYIIK